MRPDRLWVPTKGSIYVLTRSGFGRIVTGIYDPVITLLQFLLKDLDGVSAEMIVLDSLHLCVLDLPQQATDVAVDKSLDSAVAFAQSLSQWAYITIGASVALLFRDLSQRPKQWFVRWSFVVFLPGWFFLGSAIFKGVRVHGAYIAYLMTKQHDVPAALVNINADAASQLSALECGLLIFGGCGNLLDPRTDFGRRKPAS